MSGSHRLPEGGRIDRNVPLRFTVDGVEHVGYRGDTLASALVADGALQVAPSLYRRRPRGIVAAGAEEPNALVQLDGACSEPMLAATTVELYDGLVAETLSGLGRLDETPDPATYDKKFIHADVLVVGGGPAGLAAALAASAGGARVILVDDQPEFGGSLLSTLDEIDGRPALDWVRAARHTLSSRPETRVLHRSTAFGYYDGNYVLVAERRTDHLGADAPTGVARQRLWHIRARRVVLATGAHERPLVFADNDRPGIMLASAVRTYVNRYAALPGREAVVFTTKDSAYGSAFDLVAAGARVAAVVDTRPEPPADLVAAATAVGVEVLAGSAVCGTSGDPRVTAVSVTGLAADGTLTGAARRIDCDLLAVSGGWNPLVHLFSQSRGTLRWDDDLAAFVPDRSAQAERTVGAARGTLDLAGCLAAGAEAGAEAAALTGYPSPAPAVPAVPAGTVPALRRTAPQRPLWVVPAPAGQPGDWHDHFVDLQRDGTVASVWRATGAGMRSPEHIKRYTSIGTGQDQGRTSGVATLGVIAEALGVGSPGDVGTTTFRAPYLTTRSPASRWRTRSCASAGPRAPDSP